MKRIFYRIGQYRRAVRENPDPAELGQVEALLSPALLVLFNQMLPFEQAHAIRVFTRLQARGYSQPELLVAALLHDVGKARYPLRAWQRAVAVLAKGFFPGRVKKWGQGQPGGLWSGIVVAEQHPLWGAQMAGAAGAPELVVRLIAQHQDGSLSNLSAEDQVLLDALQAVDEIS